MNQDKPNPKQPTINILTPEEKSSYRAFAHRLQTLDHANLFRLNNGSADELTGEMKDLVAWEIRIREIEALKKQGIDVHEVNSYKHANEDVVYGDGGYMGGIIQKGILAERNNMDGMTDDLLKRSMDIIEDHPVRIKEGDNSIFKKNGGGINYMARKILIECKNGDEIIINHKDLQEHFRKEYIRKMSEVTGIDYTKYDLHRDSEIFSGTNPDSGDREHIIMDSHDISFNANSEGIDFSDDNYEDD